MEHKTFNGCTSTEHTSVVLGAQLHYSNSCVTTCLLGAKRSRLESWPDATQSDRKKVEQTIAWAGLTSKLEANDRALGKGDIFGCHIGAGRSASTVPSPSRSRSVFFSFQLFYAVLHTMWSYVCGL